MVLSTRRWHVGTIVARVRASTAIGASALDATSRSNRRREVLRIAEGVDAGRIRNDEAAAAFARIAADVESEGRGSLGPALGA